MIHRPRYYRTPLTPEKKTTTVAIAREDYEWITKYATYLDVPVKQLIADAIKQLREKNKLFVEEEE